MESGVAQAWFRSLPPGSIYNFSDLVEQFRNHFISGRRRQKASVELMSVKQGKDESLRDYLTRFNKEAITVSKSKPDVVIMALQYGLRPGPFRDYLTKSKVETLAQAMHISDDYITLE